MIFGSSTGTPGVARVMTSVLVQRVPRPARPWRPGQHYGRRPARGKAMGTYNHTGQVVTDLERSKRFYQEVLGFRPWYEITPPDEATAKLNCLEPPLGVTASYLCLDGLVLELMHYSAAGSAAPFRPRTMNEPGLTHLSISVDDVRATAAK